MPSLQSSSSRSDIMSAYLLSSPSQAHTYNTSYGMYSTGSYSSLAGALCSNYESTPRIAVSQTLRNQASFYVNPSNARSTLAPYPLSTQRTLSSSELLTTTTRTNSPQSSLSSDTTCTPDEHGPLLPGAVIPTESCEDLWGPTYNTGSPRSRQVSNYTMASDAAYSMYNGYAAHSQELSSSPPEVPTAVSSPIMTKLESPELQPMSYSQYDGYRSYLNITPGTMANHIHPAVTQQAYYAVSPTNSQTPCYATEAYTGVVDPRAAFYQPVSPSAYTTVTANELSPSSNDGNYNDAHYMTASAEVHSDAASSDDEHYQQPVYNELPQMPYTTHTPTYPSGAPSDMDTELIAFDDEYMESSSGSEYDDSMDDNYSAGGRATSARRRQASYESVSDGLLEGPGGRFSRGRTSPMSSIPLPRPIPNLTKKSRGRHVPTASTLVVKGGISKPSRAYVCSIDGCGKCFARGEHLKRHIRSIHTNEKPFRCTYHGCDKAFSRYDNLGQHMRIHSNRRHH